jgi:hypothetical protein
MGANKRLFPGMGEFMSLQVSLGDKLLVALIADEWSLSGMSPHVSFEIACLRKFLKALLKRTY